MVEGLLIDLHFLPSLEFFCAVRDFNEIIIERHERFVKQSYRNRCYILTSHRVEMLTVPLTARRAGMFYRDVRIDRSRQWQVRMSRTIMSAYRSAPFYEHYASDLDVLLSSGQNFLYDLNREVLSFCLKALRWKKILTETTSYEDHRGNVPDYRGLISDREAFSSRALYRPFPYYQVFGASFSPNLSLIDLLFCCGPEAGEILAKSIPRTP